MKTFTVDSENNITVFASMQEAKTRGFPTPAEPGKGTDQTDAVLFTTQEELGKLAAHWPTHRLVDIWNSLPGFTPVKKFTDRKTAIARIWKAIQSLEPAAAPEAKETRDTRKSAAGKRGKASKAEAEGPKAPREGSKNATILELLRRPEGATLSDLTAATGWQAHSVRGFLSAVVGKKLGLKLESRKREDGQRAYSIS